MKVALVCFRIDMPLSGVLRYSDELANHLTNEGIDVVRIANAPVGGSDVAYLRSTSDWNFTTKMSLRLDGFVRSEKVDLVHIVGGFPNSGILRRLAVPVIYQFFGSSLEQLSPEPSVVRKLLDLVTSYRSSWVMNRTLRNANHFIAHSELAIDVLVNRYSVGRTHVSLVPISTDVSIGIEAFVGADSFKVLVVCDSHSRKMVLRALLEMDRLVLERIKGWAHGGRIRILCDYASYFTMLRTIKTKGLDDLVECIESRSSEDLLKECIESSCVIIPEKFLSRDRLIAEAYATDTTTIDLVSHLDDSALSGTLDCLYSNWQRGSSSQSNDMWRNTEYRWDHALPGIVKIYADLFD